MGRHYNMFLGAIFAAFSALAADRVLVADSARADIFDDYGDAQESFDFQAEVGLFSRRLFRGQDLYDRGSVQPRLRAQANVDAFSLYLEGFGHIETESTHDEENPAFSELDYDLGAFTKLDALTLHLGHRWYSYTKKTARLDNTGEFFGKLQLDAIAQPYVEVDYDWDTYKGWFGKLGAEVPVPLDIEESKTSIIPFAELSYSSDLSDGPMAIYADDGFVALDFGLRGEVYVAEEIYIEPEIQYTAAFDDAADNVFTFGIRLGGKTGAD